MNFVGCFSKIFWVFYGCFRWVLFYQIGGFLVGLCKGLKVFMLSIGVLFDFFINLAKVLSGDGGIVTAFCLYFLVTTSIRCIGEGCAVSSFGEFLGLVK